MKSASSKAINLRLSKLTFLLAFFYKVLHNPYGVATKIWPSSILLY